MVLPKIWLLESNPKHAGPIVTSLEKVGEVNWIRDESKFRQNLSSITIQSHPDLVVSELMVLWNVVSKYIVPNADHSTYDAGIRCFYELRKAEKRTGSSSAPFLMLTTVDYDIISPHIPILRSGKDLRYLFKNSEGMHDLRFLARELVGKYLDEQIEYII